MQVNKQSSTIIREWIRDNGIGKYFFISRDEERLLCLYIKHSQRTLIFAFKGYHFRVWHTGVIMDIDGLSLLPTEWESFIIRSKHDVKEMMIHGLNDLCSRTTDLRLKVLLEVVKNAK